MNYENTEENTEEFYSEESIIDLTDNDEMDLREHGFMMGYMGAI